VLILTDGRVRWHFGSCDRIKPRLCQARSRHSTLWRRRPLASARARQTIK
jgi:hypothetical protein